jgi:hypothetical protein
MRHARTRPCALAAGAVACATPRLELETSLMCNSHDPSTIYDERGAVERATKGLFSRPESKMNSAFLALDSAHMRANAAAHRTVRESCHECRAAWRMRDEHLARDVRCPSHSTRQAFAPIPPLPAGP